MLSNIKSYFTIHDTSRIVQGDILKCVSVPIIMDGDKVESVEYPFLIIVSQDCDLAQCENISSSECQNAFLANVLALPALLSSDIKMGTAYSAFNIKQNVKSQKEIENIFKGKDDRYFGIKENEDITLPELIIDFKYYITVPYLHLKSTYSRVYLATINELFRENLSRKFTNYLSRIGLPEINF